MGRQLTSVMAFNRGLVSRLGLGRIDIKRLALSAEVMTNWMPRVLGSMSLRPGLGYLGATLNNAAARFLPFVFSTTDTALLELTSGAMRVWISDALVSRPAVGTTITNGTFAANLTGWTDSDEAGGTSSWVAPSYMQLVGNGTAAAIRDQKVTCANPNVEHGLRIVIARGPVTLRVGSAQGADDYVTETVLQTGTHSLAITPNGDFWIRFLSRQEPAVWIDACTVEAAGVMQLPTSWTASDLDNVRVDQSADVIFVACYGRQQRRIERRASRSWSVVLYMTPDGPFRVQNTGPITITPSGLSGNVTLAASAPLFRSGHVGALFQVTSSGQVVTKSITAANVFSDPIKITGVGASRAFVIVISGLATTGSVVVLQYSLDTPGNWLDVPDKVWKDGIGFVSDTVESYQDTLDNQIVYYRIGIEAGLYYVAGTIDVRLSTSIGSITGVARITDYTSSVSVGAEVVKALGGTFATDTWAEGSWSDFRGWPSAVCFYEGRLWWAGKGSLYGSISDAFDSFDPNFVGDAGAIQRSIGSGPVDNVNWMLALNRLLIGTPGAEFSVRSTSIDEPLTPTNFSIKPASTQGSSRLRPLKIDMRGVFVNRSGIKVFECIQAQSFFVDFTTDDMTAMVPELGLPGIVRIDCQRQPDTRIHCVRSDGVAMVAVSDKNEDVQAWLEVETDGVIEDVVVLPAVSGNIDDQVYYVVRRTINGGTVRYLEKWAQEIECRGDRPLCKLADAFVTYSGGPTNVISGLSHLEGKQVVVWADGRDVGTDDSTTPWTQRYTVSGGQITLANAASNVVVGLFYQARWKSTKLGTAMSDVNVPLNQQKRVNHLGLVLADVYPKGLKFGQDFDYLDDMPGIERGAPVGTATEAAYDENTIEFPGSWDTDMRLCLQAQAPRPCTVLAATVDIEIHK